MPVRLSACRGRWALLWPLVLVVLMVAGGAAAAPEFPVLTGRIVDQAGLLTAAERQSLGDALAAHQARTGQQLVVVTLRSLGGASIEDYGYQLGRHWGIGEKGKDTGVLLIVAPAERKVRIEVGYGLEGTLTDAASRLIIERVIVPSFRSGQFGPGIAAGVGAILKVLAGDAPPAAAAPRKRVEDRRDEASPLAILLIFVLIFFFIVMARRGVVLLPSPGSRYPQRRSRWRDWGGGGGWGGGSGGGGWGGGSGSGGGGFSGGGGSFGGGGASGSW